MLNNRSDETKNMRANLLNMYKQDMIVNQERKNQEKQQRILEERKYLERANIQFEEERLKKQNDKTMLMNQRMEEYNTFINNKMNSKLKNRLPQSTQNQENRNPGLNNNNHYSTPNNTNDLQNNSPNYENYYNQGNTPQNNFQNSPQDYGYNDQPNELYMRKEDSGNKIDYAPNNSNVPYDRNYNTVDIPSSLPSINNQSNIQLNGLTSGHQESNSLSNNTNHNNNIPSGNNTKSLSHYNTNNNYYNPQLSEYDLAVRTKKYEQQMQYKNYLDSQVTNNRQNRSQSSARVYETNRQIPLKKQGNDPLINPFSSKNYDFGGSNLNSNPILNPMNNYGYNKYITPGSGQKQPSTSDKFQRAANNIIG